MATIRITWIDSITPDVTEHKIYRDDVFLASVANGVQTYDDTTAVSGSTYKYEVQALNPTGESTDEVQGVNMDYVTAALVPDPANMWSNQFFTDTNDDGIADDTTASLTTTTVSIVTGGGHVGNAQRAVNKVGATANGYILLNNINVLTGVEYVITFEIKGQGANAVMLFSGASSSMYVSKGDGVNVVSKSVTFTATGDRASMHFYVGGNADGDWYEISNFVIKPTS